MSTKPDIDLSATLESLFRTRGAQLGWLLIMAILTRISVFGDTNYFNDELFYFQAGLRMHDGVLPYVGVWDRKGPGLFLTYWLITFFSRSILAYQVAALIAVTATAWCVNLMAERYTGRVGAILGSSLYIVLLPVLGGGGGQSPVFYNLSMAMAALILLRALPAIEQGIIGPRVYAAMLLAGFTLTFKQSSICECLFLGGYVLWRLWQNKVPLPQITRIVLGLVAAGTAPMLMFAAFYGWIGHFPEFWHAMVTANLRKTYDAAGDHWQRIGVLIVLISPAMIPAIGGFLSLGKAGQPPRAYLIGWLIAAVAGVCIVPNWFEHYMLPLCVPACVAASIGFGHRRVDPLVGYGVLLLVLLFSPALDFDKRQASRAGMASLVQDIRARDANPRLFVFEGPVDLYRQFNYYPPSPLYYPLHLFFPPENNVSHLSTGGEVRKILASRPTVIMTFHSRKPDEANQDTAPLVLEYINANCRLWFTRQLVELFAANRFDVWGCSANRALSPEMAAAQAPPR